MSSQNGANASTTPSDSIDSLKSNFKNVVDYLTSHAPPTDDKAAKKTGDSASVTSFISKAGKAIKDHPIAAVGIAFGVGYLFMRLIRR